AWGFNSLPDPFNLPIARERESVRGKLGAEQPGNLTPGITPRARFSSERRRVLDPSRDLRRKGSGPWYWSCYSTACPEHGKGMYKGWTREVVLRRPGIDSAIAPAHGHTEPVATPKAATCEGNAFAPAARERADRWRAGNLRGQLRVPDFAE